MELARPEQRPPTIPPEVDKVGRIRDEPRRAGLPPLAVTLLTEQRAALFAEGVSSEFASPPALADARGTR